MRKVYNEVRRYLERISDQPPLFNKMDEYVSVRFWVGGDGYTCRVQVNEDEKELVLTFVGHEIGLPKAKQRSLASLFKRANKEVVDGSFTFKQELGLYFFRIRTICDKNIAMDVEEGIKNSLRIFAAARGWVLDVVHNNERPGEVMDEWCKEKEAAEAGVKG